MSIIKSFTVVSRPDYPDHKNNQWNRVSLANHQKYPLEPTATQLKNSKLIHPRDPNLQTFGIWQDSENLDSYYVKDSGNVGYLDNLECDNLLFMPTLYGYKNVRIIDNVNNNSCYYQAIPLEELEFSSSLVIKYNDLAGIIFKQIYETQVTKETKEINIVDQKNQCNGEAIGWLNPVIWKFKLNGDDLKDIDQNSPNDSNIIHRVLRLFFTPSALLRVEPDIDNRHELRISILKQFQEYIINRSTPSRNLFEYMLFGGEPPNSWKPFLWLDLLGGKFFVHKHGTQPNILWDRPPQLSSNADWFANYCLSKWVGEKHKDGETVSNISIVQPPSSPQPYGSISNLETFTIDNLDLNQATCGSILKYHPLSKEEGTFYHFLVYKLFKEYEGSEKDKCHYGCVRLIDRDQNKVSFDDIYFIKRFSERYVAPNSPILIAIPQVKNRFVDPVRSINNGEYHFLLQLFKSLKCQDTTDHVELENKFGWWNNWYLTLFEKPWNIHIKFKTLLPVLGQFRCGEDYLGEKGQKTPPHWNNQIMHF